MYISKKELNVLLDTVALLKVIKNYDGIEKTNKFLDYGITMAHLNTNLNALTKICKTQIEKRNKTNEETWNRIKTKRAIDPTYARSYIQKEKMLKKEMK